MNLNKNLTGNKIEKRLGSNFWYDFVKVTGALPTLLWVRPRILRPYGNKTPKGAVLISSNHPTFIDPILVHCAFMWRRLHCLATKDLYSTKVRSFFFKQMHCIIADKKNFSMSSFHEVVNRLKEGKAVVIFPEGQVNQQDSREVMAFKSGAVLMAHKGDAPILPMCIIKREKWYHRQVILVGEPVHIRTLVSEKPSMEEMIRASEYLREKEVELMTYYRMWRQRQTKNQLREAKENGS